MRLYKNNWVLNDILSIMDFHRKQMDFIMESMREESIKNKVPQFSPADEVIENDVNKIRFEETNGGIRFHDREDEAHYLSKHE